MAGLELLMAAGICCIALVPLVAIGLAIAYHKRLGPAAVAGIVVSALAPICLGICCCLKDEANGIRGREAMLDADVRSDRGDDEHSEHSDAFYSDVSLEEE